MKNQKNTVLMCLGILILAGIGISGYYFSQKKTSEEPKVSINKVDVITTSSEAQNNNKQNLLVVTEQKPEIKKEAVSQVSEEGVSSSEVSVKITPLNKVTEYGMEFLVPPMVNQTFPFSVKIVSKEKCTNEKFDISLLYASSTSEIPQKIAKIDLTTASSTTYFGLFVPQKLGEYTIDVISRCSLRGILIKSEASQNVSVE